MDFMSNQITDGPHLRIETVTAEDLDDLMAERDKLAKDNARLREDLSDSKFHEEKATTRLGVTQAHIISLFKEVDSWRAAAKALYECEIGDASCDVWNTALAQYEALAASDSPAPTGEIIPDTAWLKQAAFVSPTQTKEQIVIKILTEALHRIANDICLNIGQAGNIVHDALARADAAGKGEK